LVIAFLVTLPALGMGFVLDDWAQRGVVRGTLHHTTRFDLFSFATSERGVRELMGHGFPWFTAKELRLRFIRPLSSALIVLDTEVFGDTAWPQHLHSSLWYVALVAVALALYRKVLPEVAIMAAVLFALDDSHTTPAAWLANRNAMVSVLFVWFGLHAHLEWRTAGKAWAAPASALAYGLGLSAGESAVSAMAYVVAFELVHSEGHPRRLRSTMMGLVPALVVLGSYGVVYKVTGAGARAGATYVDPIAEPINFLVGAGPRFLGNVGMQAFGLPDLWLILPSTREVLIAAGAAGLLLLALAWRRWAPSGDDRTALRWLLLGAVGAMIPGLATFPATRLLTPASLGLAPVIAVLLRGAWRDRGAARALGLAWLVGAFVLQPLTAWLTMPLGLRSIASRSADAIRDLHLSGQERVVMVSTSEFAPAVFGTALIDELRMPAPASWSIWSMAPLAVSLRRIAEGELELGVEGGRMVDSVFEQNFRGETYPMRIGDQVELVGQRLTVLSVDAGHATSVRIELTRPVGDFTFVWWNGDTLERLELPRVGEQRVLPRTDTILERVLRARSGD
jgi:hypothetical protein